jgi:hypothetical protein
MATYYARDVGGNWNANTSWDSVSSAGAGPAGPPIAGDTAVFDAGSTGTITLTAAAACLNLNMANHGGTLALVAQTLSIGANGSIVLGGTITATTGTIACLSTVSITSNAIKFPGTLRFAASATYTLVDNLSATDLVIWAANPTFAGENITCDNFYWPPSSASACSLTLVSGKTLTISTLLYLMSCFSNPGTQTVKSSTATSEAFLHYNGTAANCIVANMIFTDINCAHPIYNWNGGTLTRCTGIRNVGANDIGHMGWESGAWR